MPTLGRTVVPLWESLVSASLVCFQVLSLWPGLSLARSSEVSLGFWGCIAGVTQIIANERPPHIHFMWAEPSSDTTNRYSLILSMSLYYMGPKGACWSPTFGGEDFMCNPIVL